jgi:predicted ArsR family transcriptional regulator
MDAASDLGPQESAGGDADFSAVVTALSSAFGDPSRRAIYLHLRGHPHLTVAELAEVFSLHPNVVRHHLDRLVAGGYLEVEAPQRSMSAGRPAKRYVAVAGEHGLERGTRQDELIVALLEKALGMLGPERAERMAAEVGRDYGMELAGRMGANDGLRSVQAAMAVVAEAMTAHGFAARAELSSGESAVVVEHCPFGEAAAHHPVLCAVDKGMVAGLLEGLGAAKRGTEVTLSSRARGDDACRATAAR